MRRRPKKIAVALLLVYIIIILMLFYAGLIEFISSFARSIHPLQVNNATTS
jgi:hypothetical protein